MFQKRHYEFLARWLRYLTIPLCTKDIVLKSLCAFLKEDNPKFDPEKFKKAVWDE